MNWRLGSLVSSPPPPFYLTSQTSDTLSLLVSSSLVTHISPFIDKNDVIYSSSISTFCYSLKSAASFYEKFAQHWVDCEFSSPLFSPFVTTKIDEDIRQSISKTDIISIKCDTGTPTTLTTLRVKRTSEWKQVSYSVPKLARTFTLKRSASHHIRFPPLLCLDFSRDTLIESYCP